MQLTLAQRDFIEAFGQLDNGTPRAMGRILGYLLICTPAAQTAKDIQEQLTLSAGSVSTMLGMLVNAGLVNKTPQAHSRKLCYEIAEDSWQRAIELRLQAVDKIKQLAQEGLKVEGSDYRLSEMYRVYDIFGKEMESALQRLKQ